MAAPAKKQDIIVADIFNGIPQEWRDLLLHASIKQEFLTVLGQLSVQDGKITPSLPLMFNFARLTPLQDIKVVILGQDPYPTDGHAHGMSFSSKADRIPMSLAKIYKALDKSGFLNKKPTSADLTHWATQGVLLINTAFTTIVDKPNEHQDIWAPYTSKLLDLIGLYKNFSNPKRVICLWGNFAKSYADKFPPEHGWTTLTYTHPVARDPHNFGNCDHFTKIKELGLDIKWDFHTDTDTDDQKEYLKSGDPEYKWHWFSDGAGKNNQSKDCKAYWGFVCTKGDTQLKGTGIVPHFNEVRPTNIRAEATALIEILKLIKSKNLDGDHLLHTDSEFWIKTMDIWLPNRFKKKDYKITDNPNSDLAQMFMDLLDELRSQKKITFQFVRAHHDYQLTKMDSANGYSPYFWAGNKAAEAMAESSIPI